MPQNLGTNYKSSFDRKNEGNIIKTDIYIKPDIKVLYHLIKEKKSSKGEEATFAVYEK
jgi:hypothetical protein